MSLLHLIITLAVIGVILWAVNTYLPMDPKVKQALNVVVMIALVIWLLSVFGLLDTASHVRVGRR